MTMLASIRESILGSSSNSDNTNELSVEGRNSGGRGNYCIGIWGKEEDYTPPPSDDITTSEKCNINDSNQYSLCKLCLGERSTTKKSTKLSSPSSDPFNSTNSDKKNTESSFLFDGGRRGTHEENEDAAIIMTCRQCSRELKKNDHNTARQIRASGSPVGAWICSEYCWCEMMKDMNKQEENNIANDKEKSSGSNNTAVNCGSGIANDCGARQRERVKGTTASSRHSWIISSSDSCSGGIGRT